MHPMRAAAVSPHMDSPFDEEALERATREADSRDEERASEGSEPVERASDHNYTPKSAFLEFGSTSIKFYVIEQAGEHACQVEREMKIPWELGLDVFQHRRISPSTVTRCLATLEAIQREYPEIPFPSVTAVGTAALREAQNVEVFQRVLWDRLGLKIRIIEGGIEAFLLESGFRESVEVFPTALFDLGGGSLELVEYLSPNSTRKTSIHLGTIRLHCHLRHTRDLLEYIREGRIVAERVLRTELLDHTLGYHELIGTAGTVRAIATVLRREEFDLEDVQSLLQREIHGPVAYDIPPHRRKLLLPGLIILEAMFTCMGLERIVLRTASVKQGLIGLTKVLPAGGL